MLLQQQEWLVSGLLELYRRTQLNSSQLDESPTEAKRRAPSVHHILGQLGILDGSHRFVAADPVIAADTKQYSCDGSGDAHKKTLYSPDEDPCGEQFGTYDEVQNGSFGRISTTAAADDTFMWTIDDPHAALLGFQNTAQKADSTPSGQHSGAGFLYRHDLLISGLDEPIREVTATTVQTAFEIPVPPAGYSDTSSIYPRDIFRQQSSRSSLAQTTPAPGQGNLAHHNFRSAAFPTMRGRVGFRS